jgi:RHS repeat-associated protein
MSYSNEHLSNGKSWETNYHRDELGLEIGRSMPGGIQSKWKRDNLGRPIELSINSAEKLVRTRKYSWGINDRLQQIEDSLTGTTTFAHDAFGNLAKATYSDGTSLFRAPDAIGNLYRSPDRTDRKYGPAGQLLEASTSKGIVKYEYDAEGNLKKKIEPDNKEWNYIWNSSGMLSEVKRPDGKRVKFTYDPLGRRMSKSYNGRITKWVWDGNVLLHEWVEHYDDVNEEDEIPDSLQSDEISTASLQTQLDGRPSNGPPDEGDLPATTTWLFDPDTFAPASKIVGDKHYSIITDHLGTPLSMFDETGVQTWGAELDIFGSVKNLLGDRNDCPFRYPGQYEDGEIGLYYNRFRYYDPEGGEYVSQDPIGLKGNNPTLYGYVADLNIYDDPFGLNCRNTKPRIENGNLKEGWIHIDTRHITGNHPKGAGDLFAAGTSKLQLERAANKIIKKGNRVTEDITARMQTFEKKMVINGKKDLVRMTVDSLDNNRVITMFPVRGG